MQGTRLAPERSLWLLSSGLQIDFGRGASAAPPQEAGMTIEAVRHAALALGFHDRAELAAALLATLDEGEPEPDVDSAWEVEAERRVGELDAGRTGTISWPDVRARAARGR